MGAKNLVMLKTHIDSVNIRFVNEFVYKSMLWASGSLWGFVCNYVFYSFGLIIRYFFRFQVGDTKNEVHVHSPQADQTERNWFPAELANFLFSYGEDVHEIREEEDRGTEISVLRGREADESIFVEGGFDVHETECSVVKEENTVAYEHSEYVHEEALISAFNDTVPDVLEDVENRDKEIESSILMEANTENHDDTLKRDEETESSGLRAREAEESVFVKGGFDVHETECSVLKEKNSVIHEYHERKGGEPEPNVHEEGRKIDDNEFESSILRGRGTEEFFLIEGGINAHETEYPVLKESNSALHENVDKNGGEAESTALEDGKEIDEDETESSIHHDSKKKEEAETKGDSVFADFDTATTTSKCRYVSGENISGFIEEPTIMSFTFREFYAIPDVSVVSHNTIADTVITANKEFTGLNSEKVPVPQKEEEEQDSVKKQRILSVPSTENPFQFESELFGGSVSSDEDYFPFNDNSLESDSESESSSSSGLIWSNSDKIDDSVSYQFLAGNNACERFEPEILNLMKEERADDVDPKQLSWNKKFSGFNYAEDKYIDPVKAQGKAEKESSDHEKELNESDSDEGGEDFEWEHDDLVEQLKLELRNARQGGLATILEEAEEEEEETESPKLVEDLKPLKIEEKVEYRDHIGEIEKVYKSYAEKMRKLDVLNYQTMHAIGLLQLKEPLKLISASKSTVPGAKPLISQNLWPRKAPKNKSDSLLKFVHELHRDLELVYVGQVCLSWEILCWQLKKAQELRQYDSQGSRTYNIVAGEFQLFQVLMQRFIENEPFQGTTRIQNYVKNRCVIRNLLQVPAIKDDSMKDKNTEGGEENAIASEKLAEIVKASMRVFWEFAKADKDYGNVIFKVTQQIRNDIKDPAISDLLIHIRNQQQKKERWLKDLVRSGNCIVRKFQKHRDREDELDHEQLLAQVGLRLISRVSNMSKLRKEHLIWCNEKLHRIKFLSRKIVQVEPSFLLFPC